MNSGRSEPAPLSSAPSAELIQRIRQAAFQCLLAGGRATTAELAVRTAIPDAAVIAAVAALVSAKRAVTDNDGSITGIAGLSLAETRHQLRVNGGKQLWCWCAWDAFGVAAALLLTAEAVTSCGACGQPLTVTVVSGQVAGDRAEHGFRPGPAGSPLSCFCPYALLFCSSEHLQTWREELPAGVSGESMPVARYAAAAKLGWIWAAPAMERDRG